MPLTLEEFQQPEFQGYIETIARENEYLLENVMPRRNIYDKDFSYSVIQGEYAQAASITAFNAAAPLRDPQEVTRHFGSVAKIQHGMRLDETMLLQFNRPRVDAERDEVIDYIYRTSQDLTRGVQDTEEYLRAQAIYRGAVDYAEGDLSINVDFGIPEENRITASTPWSGTDATPLTDLQTAVRQFQSTNARQRPVVMHMTSATEAMLLNSDQIRYQIYGDTAGQRLVTRNDLQNVFTALGLPPYTINDDVLNITGEEEPLLEDGRVVLLGQDLGNTYLGPTVENNYNAGIYVITEVKETNPPQQAIFVGETAFPALARRNAVVHLDV